MSIRSLAVITLALAAVSTTGARQLLTVERVASLPSLIGTAPASPAWAPDSRRLAFRWNDAGEPFRDVWLVDADGRGLRRVTDLRLTHPTPPPPDGTTTEALAARAAGRARGGVSEMVWLPDNRRLLVVSGGEIYRVDVDGGGPPQRLDLGRGVSDLALSPDGSRLAFLRGGDVWLWSIDAASPPRRLTNLAVDGIGRVPLGTYNRADVEVGPGVWGADWTPIAWSPDARTLAFHVADRRHIRRVPFPSYLGSETVVSELRRGYPGDENERRSLGVVGVDDGTIRMLPLDEPGRRSISDFAWSPRGQLLVDQVSDTGTDRWLFVVDGADAAPRLVWHDQRQTRIYPAYQARWHSDGHRIVFVADLTDRDHLYVIDPRASSPTPVAITAGVWDVAGERGAASVHVAADASLFFTATLKSPYERQVYRQQAGASTPVAVTRSAGVHVPTVSPDGRSVASLWSDDITPTELVIVSATGDGAEHRVTSSPHGEFRQHAWVRPRYATFRNAVDGFTVHARILEPSPLDRTRRHPVIVGPVYSNTVRNRWGGLAGTLQQFLVQQGYIVVQADVRGSVGYGRAFREAFLMDYGGKDLDDLEAVVRGLRALPYVDGARMGIWGSSYGGLLTVFALLDKPSLFAAGVAGAPAVDPHAFGPDDVAITRTPATHPDAFVRGSALRLGADLRAPLLIIHGLMDDVVPFRTTMALAERLMLLGKDFDVATAPAATHAWTAREHYAVYFYRKIVQFFDRHLRAR
jgi:dipeptidyl-peptidase-4